MNALLRSCATGAVAVSLAACSPGSIQDSQSSLRLKRGVTVLAAERAQSAVVAPDSLSFPGEGNEGLLQLNQGHVLVGASKAGFLRTVQSVQRDSAGGIVVQTSAAGLGDVFEDGDYRAKLDVASGALISQQVQQGGTGSVTSPLSVSLGVSFKNPITSGSITVQPDGHLLGGSPTLDLHVWVKNGTAYADVSWENGSIDALLPLLIQAQDAVSVFVPVFNIKVPVGVIPPGIPLVLDVTFQVGATMSSPQAQLQLYTGASAHVDYSVVTHWKEVKPWALPAVYVPAAPPDISFQNASAELLPPSLGTPPPGVQVSETLEADLQIGLRIADIAGPYFTPRLSTTETSDFGYGDCAYNSWGMDVIVGAQAGVSFWGVGAGIDVHQDFPLFSNTLPSYCSGGH